MQCPVPENIYVTVVILRKEFREEFFGFLILLIVQLGTYLFIFLLSVKTLHVFVLTHTYLKGTRFGSCPYSSQTLLV